MQVPVRACVQPTVEQYDITQLHENTYYDVCVKVFTTPLSVDSDYDDFDGQRARTVDFWDNYEGSGTAFGEGRLYRQSASAGGRVQ